MGGRALPRKLQIQSTHHNCRQCAEPDSHSTGKLSNSGIPLTLPFQHSQAYVAFHYQSTSIGQQWCLAYDDVKYALARRGEALHYPPTLPSPPPQHTIIWGS